MPTSGRRENTFIERFLSAYENQTWADARMEWLDEKVDGAVEAIATRSDGKTLAIEHTIIEPFVGEKRDFSFFEAAFLKIEEDKELPVPKRWIRVFIPVGWLQGQHKRSAREAIVREVHSWLKSNRLLLPDGNSEHRCSVRGKDMSVFTKVVPLSGPGKLHVRRQQVVDDFDQVIERCLKRKVPKLAQTSADKRILLLERQHMILTPERMMREIKKQESAFPILAKIDEIWIVETMSYESEGYLYFERFEEGTLVASLGPFKGPTLLEDFE